jgi:hypothetical protein
MLELTCDRCGSAERLSLVWDEFDGIAQKLRMSCCRCHLGVGYPGLRDRPIGWAGWGMLEFYKWTAEDGQRLMDILQALGKLGQGGEA